MKAIACDASKVRFGLRRIARDEGSILVMLALVLVVLFGISALALDAGYLYETRNRMGAAADAAARGAIIALKNDIGLGTDAGRTANELPRFGRHAAQLHGFVHGTDGVDVTINYPPASGPFAGNYNFVEAIITQPRSTFFANVLGRSSFMVANRAVAGGFAGSDCIIALGNGSPPSGGNVTAEGSATVNLPGCNVQANGNIGTTGSSSITAGGFENYPGGPGTYSGNLTPTPPNASGSQFADPYASLAAPYLSTWENPCDSVGAVHHGYTTRSLTRVSNPASSLLPGIYCGGITMENGTRSFAGGTDGVPASAPGMYIIYGADPGGPTGGTALWITSATVTGSGVTFYNTGGTFGRIYLAGTSTAVTLSAATGGTYNGILFFQDRANTIAAEIRGGTTNYNLSGAVYIPSAALTLAGGSSTNALELGVVARSVSFAGQVTLAPDDDSSTPGGSTAKLDLIAE